LAVVASFTHNSSWGGSLTVQFTDTSIGSPDVWFWNFGDGSISWLRNPVHTYINVGAYIVTLETGTNIVNGNINQTANNQFSRIGYRYDDEPSAWEQVSSSSFTAGSKTGLVASHVSNNYSYTTDNKYTYGHSLANGVKFDMTGYSAYNKAIMYYKMSTSGNPLPIAGIWDFQISQTVGGAPELPPFLDIPKPSLPNNTNVYAGSITSALGTNPVFYIFDTQWRRTGEEVNVSGGGGKQVGYSFDMYVHAWKYSDWDAVSQNLTVSKPIVDFSGTPLTGDSPLNVQFTDLSNINAVKSVWDFGDGNTVTVSGSTNPVNTYTSDACSVY